MSLDLLLSDLLFFPDESSDTASGGESAPTSPIEVKTAPAYLH